MMYFESPIHSIIHLFNLQLNDFREIMSMNSSFFK